MLEEKSVVHNLFTDLSRTNPEFKLFVPAKNNTLEIVKLSVDSVCLFFDPEKIMNQGKLIQKGSDR